MIHHPIDIAEMFHAEGVTRRDRREIAVAVCWAESRFDDQAKLDNTQLDPPGKGIDRGLMQINSFWHPDVSDECAFEPKCNIHEAVAIYRDWGNSFGAWTAFKNGAYKAFLPEAEIAVEAQIRLRALARAKDAEKAAIQAEVDRLTHELELMRAARLAMEAEIERLKGEVVVLEAQKAELVIQVVNATDALAAKDTEIGRLTTELDDVQTRLETAKQNFTAMQVEQSIAIFGE